MSGQQPHSCLRCTDFGTGHLYASHLLVPEPQPNRRSKHFSALFKIDDTVSGRFQEDVDVPKQRAYVQLALCSALKAPLPLPGSYFSALLAAPSSSGCFCGRGTVLETWLPFIALNVTRRSLGSVSLLHASLLAMAWQEGMRFFPSTFLQTDNALPAVPGALRSRAGGLPALPCSQQP